MTGKRWFWLAVALQVLLLLGLIGRHSYTLATGTPVLLKTEPVDPWDPFRGEYVILNYTISRIEDDSVPMQGAPYQRGQQVWVTLHPADPFWVAKAVSNRRPSDLAGGEVALKGTVQWHDPGWTGGPEATKASVVIRYGIEQFFVPEGEGKGLEGRQREMHVEAVVDSFGRAALKRVFLEGKEIRWQ